MKCIKCGKDSKYKERSSGKCLLCGMSFAFEPRSGDKLTDAAFLHAIEAVSGGGKLKWLKQNLYYEICRRLATSRTRQARIGAWFFLILASVIFLGATVVIWNETHIVVAAIGTGSVVSGLFWLGAFLCFQFVRKKGKTTLLSQGDFEVLWQKWIATHGVPPGLIERRAPKENRRAKESDLHDYSFDRAIICDRSDTVDLLLANNFHFENNCAILGFDGYPAEIFDVVKKMLKRNPRLHVFALHDASPEGCRMPSRLAFMPDWFHGHALVTDVGLRPSHHKPFLGLLLPSSAGTVMESEGITHEEALWLSSYKLELAAIRPEQILKRMFKAINRRQASDTGGDGSSGTSSSSDGSSMAATGESGGGDFSGGDSGGGGASGGWSDGGLDSDSSSFGSDAGDSDGGGGDGFG